MRHDLETVGPRVARRRARAARKRTRAASLALAAALVLGLVPLRAAPAAAQEIEIRGEQVLSARHLVAFYKDESPGDPDLTVPIEELARYFIEEGKTEGVRGDIAFAQAIHETDWFRYTGEVPPDYNNFAGIGATGGVPGNKFTTARLGVRAQIHHLRAYADPAMEVYHRDMDPDSPVLSNPPVKPENEPVARFTELPREKYGSAPTWESLTGNWATDPAYDEHVLGHWADLLAHASHLDGAVPLSGDWNGDGRSTPGWYDDGRVYLTNSLSGRSPDLVYTYGRKGDIPVVGDWDGDGVDTIGIVRGGHWHLRNAHRGGDADLAFRYGRILDGDYPLAGDWNGNGVDTVGIVRGGEWHLRNTNSGGPGQIVYTYGRVRLGDVPITGDWSGNGQDTPGIVRGAEWHLRSKHAAGHADIAFTFGRSGDLPVTGDWNRDGVDTPGVVRHHTWHLRNVLRAGGADHSLLYDAR